MLLRVVQLQQPPSKLLDNRKVPRRIDLSVQTARRVTVTYKNLRVSFAFNLALATN